MADPRRPTGAASTATHCAVFAQLIVKGKKHGVKTFVVQLRDTKSVPPLNSKSHLDRRISQADGAARYGDSVRTFQLKPGVMIGDIGKKMGRDGIDNGYIQVSHPSVTPSRS